MYYKINSLYKCHRYLFQTRNLNNCVDGFTSTSMLTVFVKEYVTLHVRYIIHYKICLLAEVFSALYRVH